MRSRMSVPYPLLLAVVCAALLLLAAPYGRADTPTALIQQLQQGDMQQRMQAAQALGGYHSPEAVDALVAALGDDNPLLRGQVAAALGAQQDARAIAPLSKALKDDFATVRLQAVKALGMMADAQVVPLLIGCLQDADSGANQEAAQGLARWTKDPRVSEAFLAAMKSPAVLVRASAAGELGRKLSDAAAVDALVNALQDKEASVRIAAIKALRPRKQARLLTPYIAALKDEDPLVRATAAKGLLVLNDHQAVNPLFAVLKDNDPAVRSAAINTLGQLNDPAALEPIFSALEDKDNAVQTQARTALVRMGPPAGEFLLTALQQEADAHRALLAAHALANTRDPRALDALLGAVRRKDQPLRLAVLQALGGQTPREEIEVLNYAHGVDEYETTPRLRFLARDLWFNQDPRVIDALLPLLQDPDREQRVLVASVLGHTGDTRALTPLCTLLKTEPEASVRSNIVNALGAIGDVRALDPLLAAMHDPDKDVAQQAGWTLSDIDAGPAHIDPLLALLHDPSPHIRIGAIYALGLSLDAKSVGPLIDVLQHDADGSVRHAVTHMLGCSGDLRAVDPFIAALSDPDGSVRAGSAMYLGRLHDPRGLEPLAQLLERDNGNERTWISSGLGHFVDPRAIQPLIERLNYFENQGRVLVISNLRRYDDPRVIPALLEQFGREKDEWVQSKLAETFGMLHAAQAVPVLCDRLEDGDCSLREECAAALGRIGGETAKAALRQAADSDEAPSVRAVAAASLWWLGDATMFTPLRAAVHSADLRTRYNALLSLSQRTEVDPHKLTEDPEAIDLLLEALGSPDAGTRSLAAKGLDGCTDARLAPPLLGLVQSDRDRITRLYAVKVLGQLHDARALDPLCAALHDREPLVRSQAADALALLGDHHACPALIDCLQHDEYSWVRAQSAVALGKLGDRVAIDPLIAALGEESPNNRTAAVSALQAITGEKIGDDRAAWQAWRKAQGQ